MLPFWVFPDFGFEVRPYTYQLDSVLFFSKAAVLISSKGSLF